MDFCNVDIVPFIPDYPGRTVHAVCWWWDSCLKTSMVSLTFLTNRKMKDYRTGPWWRTGLLPRTNRLRNPAWHSVHETLSLFPRKLNSSSVQTRYENSVICTVKLLGWSQACYLPVLTGTLPDNFQTGTGSWHGPYTLFRKHFRCNCLAVEGKRDEYGHRPFQVYCPQC